MIKATLTTEMIITRQRPDGTDYAETITTEQDMDEKMQPVGPPREVDRA